MELIAEVWHDGRSIRKTLTGCPVISKPEAQSTITPRIHEVRQGKPNGKKKQPALLELCEKYWLQVRTGITGARHYFRRLFTAVAFSLSAQRSPAIPWYNIDPTIRNRPIKVAA